MVRLINHYEGWLEQNAGSRLFQRHLLAGLISVLRIAVEDHRGVLTPDVASRLRYLRHTPPRQRAVLWALRVYIAIMLIVMGWGFVHVTGDETRQIRPTREPRSLKRDEIARAHASRSDRESG